MSFYKILGAILLVLGGGLYAHRLNSRLSQELCEAAGWSYLLQHIKNEIEYFSRPIGEILMSCDQELLTRCGYSKSERPNTLSELIAECEPRDGALRTALLEFSSEFGRCYREEQVKRCEYYLSLIEKRKLEMTEEISKKKKLNTTLFISGSLALTILFL